MGQTRWQRLLPAYSPSGSGPAAGNAMECLLTVSSLAHKRGLGHHPALLTLPGPARPSPQPCAQPTLGCTSGAGPGRASRPTDHFHCGGQDTVVEQGGLASTVDRRAGSGPRGCWSGHHGTCSAVPTKPPSLLRRPLLLRPVHRRKSVMGPGPEAAQVAHGSNGKVIHSFLHFREQNSLFPGAARPWGRQWVSHMALGWIVGVPHGLQAYSKRLARPWGTQQVPCTAPEGVNAVGREDTWMDSASSSFFSTESRVLQA